MSPYFFNVYQEYPTKVVSIFGEFAIGTNGGISPILTNAGGLGWWGRFFITFGDMSWGY